MVEGEGLQRCCFVVGAIKFKCETASEECILFCEAVRTLGGLQEECSLSVLVQCQRFAVCGTFKSVVDGHKSAFQFHHVGGVALDVVVVIIFLVCRETDGIGAVGVEHGVVEGVFHIHRVLYAYWPSCFPDGIGQFHLHFVAYHWLVVEVAFAQIGNFVVVLLGVGEQHGAVVDAIVLCVILHIHTLHLLAIGILPIAVEVVGVEGDGIGEVNHIVDLSVLEKGGVALGGDLLNLPLHWWKFHVIFARVYVWNHLHAVLSSVNFCLIVVVLIVCFVGKDFIA